MKNRYFIIFIFLIIVSFKKSQAQTSRDSESFAVKTESSSLKKKKRNIFSKKYSKNLNGGVKEFDQLMKSNVKKRAKIARKMQKPQYSDPSYFGHKRPPKKRPLGKRKFCKECGIIH